MSAGRRAIVVGGGVGGLTTAIALRRAGMEVLVLERRTDRAVTAGRWGLGLWCNAVRVLQRLGVADGVLASGPETEKLVFQTSRGLPLASWPVGDLGRRLGAPSVSISPEAMLTALERGLDGAVVERGTDVEGFSQDADGVTVRLSDGREERGDVLVGADGLRSTVRAGLFGPEPPRYAGYWVWQAIIPFEHPRAPVGIDHLLWGKGARFAFHHVEQDRLFWQCIINTPEEGDEIRDDPRGALLERLAGWRAPVEDAIAATPVEAIKGLPIYDREPARTWGRGRVTLLGDAAHPMTNNLGQGACMAIEDAVTLARTLGETDDAPAGLRAYERARMQRTATMVKLARRIGDLGTWKHPVAVRARETVMKRIFDGPVLKSHFKLLAYEV